MRSAGVLAGLLLLAGMAVAAGCSVDAEHGLPETTGVTFALTASENHLEFLLAQDSDESDQARFQQLELRSKDGTLVNWAITTDTPWISISPPAGQTSSEIDQVGVGIIPDQLTPGLYRGSITIVENTGTNASSQQQEVAITVRICATTCIFVNPANFSHKVSSLLFGGQSEFLNSGTGVWGSIVTDDCADPAIPIGGPHPEQLDEFLQLGINSLRYPSGIPSDFFHWHEAIGPIGSRIPQINPWASTHDNILKECPVFGPDEFAQYAELLDASILITTNAANGTAQEAAEWLSYYENKGIETDYWEVGNEIYIEGPEYLFDASYMASLEYAATFDAHARALRQVRPDIKVGAVISPMEQDWNRGVLAAITEPFDFLSLHSWQPQVDTCSEPDDQVIYGSLLASPLLMEEQLRLIKETAKDFAIPPNKTPAFIITEWGAWFLPCDSNGVANNDARARSMGSALLSGLIFNTMMRDPSIFSAFHSTLSSLQAQALLNIVWDNGWVPIRSAHYYVHKLYFESVGGMIIRTSTHNSPTFAAKLFDHDTVPTELPVLDSIAVLSEDSSKLFVYIVNRSLTDHIDLQLLIGDLPNTVTSVVADTVTANSFSDLNTAAQPDAVGLENSVLATSKELRLTLPVHSLVRITFSMAIQ